METILALMRTPSLPHLSNWETVNVLTSEGLQIPQEEVKKLKRRTCWPHLARCQVLGIMSENGCRYGLAVVLVEVLAL